MFLILPKGNCKRRMFVKAHNISFVANDCEDLCPRENVNITELQTYCNNLQYNLPYEIHRTIWIVIGVLFILSWLELALEACFKNMPYHKAHEPFKKDDHGPEVESKDNAIKGGLISDDFGPILKKRAKSLSSTFSF